jgi:ubiquinone/menaquinone biosynthesis C-methylase UbiE
MMHRAEAVTNRRRPGRLAAVVCLVVLLAPFESRAVQRDAADAERLIDRLALQQGDMVAEIGAGDGDLTMAMARHVGEGQVYTTELESNLDRLREAVETARLDNVTVLEGASLRTNLPEGCCDAVFMRAVYHHFGDPASMNASLLASLKPGGRLAVIDFEPRGSASADPGRRASDGSHGVAPEAVSDELGAAGFEAIERTDLDGRRFLIVARRPE